VSRRAARLAAALAPALTVLALAGCAAPRPVVRPPPPRPVVGTGEGRPPPAGAPGKAQRPLPVPLAATEYHEEPEVVGVVHLVRRGETIYRIARAYGVDQADLLEVNGIADPRQVAAGTELFVPGASRVVDLEEVTGSAPPRPAAPGPARPAASPPAPSDGHPAGPPPAPAPGATQPPAPAPGPGSAGAHVARGGKLAWPLKGVLYGRYGVRNGRRHDGIDLAAPEGSVIGAAAPGTVIFAGEQAGYGSIVILRHDDGLVTLYAHCSAVLVDEGATVRRGQPIAKVGQTGRTSGPHLHFEVREGTRPRNPLLFLP
jgi:murein DD-endopeptidase MepM/ murein hydrolase activator NlpD